MQKVETIQADAMQDVLSQAVTKMQDLGAEFADGRYCFCIRGRGRVTCIRGRYYTFWCHHD